MIKWLKNLFSKLLRKNKDQPNDPNFAHLKNKDPFIY